MERYDSYKDSGVEWIGEIPSHWSLKRLSWVASTGSGTTPKSSNDSYYSGGTINWLITGDLNDDVVLDTSKKITPKALEECRLNTYPMGSIVVAMYGATIGKLCQLGVETTVNQACCVLSSFKGILPKQVFYRILSSRDYLLFLGDGGGQPNISQEDVRSLQIPTPPLHEQEQIVEYLDRKTTLIDSLIEKTVRKIELLKEKRTSLINEVVTKGLNPDVEMKDSGVEWIGEIPSHWGSARLYQYSELKSGSTPSRNRPDFWEGGDIPWMSSGEVNLKIVREVEGRITQLGHQNSNTPVLPIGTVMMGLNGQGKTKGTVAILEIQTTCNQSLCGLIFREMVVSKFGFYFLESQYFHLRGLVGEGQREGISVSFLSRYPLVIPPLHEQEQIVEYLDEQTSIIDSTITTEEKRIELLKEYRQSLISEVVTGKVKVTRDE